MKKLLLMLMLSIFLSACAGTKSPAPALSESTQAGSDTMEGAANESHPNSARTTELPHEPIALMLNESSAKEFLLKLPREPEPGYVSNAKLVWISTKTLLLIECNDEDTIFYELDAQTAELKAVYSQPFGINTIVRHTSAGWVFADINWSTNESTYYLLDSSYQLLAKTETPEGRLNDYGQWVYIADIIVNPDFSRLAYRGHSGIYTEDGICLGSKNEIFLSNTDGSDENLLYSESNYYTDDADWYTLSALKYPLCFSEDGRFLICGNLNIGMGEPTVDGGLLDVKTGQMTEFQTDTSAGNDSDSGWRVPIGLVPKHPKQILTCGFGTPGQAIGVGIYDIDQRNFQDFSDWSVPGYGASYHGRDISEPYMFGEYWRSSSDRSVRFVFDIETEKRIEYFEYDHNLFKPRSLTMQSIAISPAHDRIISISPHPNNNSWYIISMVTMPAT